MKTENLSIEDLSKEFLKLEFKKNLKVNYFVRCMEVGDEEEYQILEQSFEEVKITNENIPLELRETINNKLEKYIEEYKKYTMDELETYDEDSILNDLGEISNLLKPYITWPELFEEQFEIWECLILEDYDGLKEFNES